MNQGERAYNGRTLDERVVNPSFNRIGYLGPKAVLGSFPPFCPFRRLDTRRSSRQEGYDAFLALIAVLEALPDDHEILDFLRCLLYRFAKLREAADVALSRVQRLSLEQLSS